MQTLINVQTLFVEKVGITRTKHIQTPSVYITCHSIGFGLCSYLLMKIIYAAHVSGLFQNKFGVMQEWVKGFQMWFHQFAGFLRKLTRSIYL